MGIKRVTKFRCDRCGETEAISRDSVAAELPSQWHRVNMPATRKKPADNRIFCEHCVRVLLRWIKKKCKRGS
jgi:hypothetical protein